MYVLLYVLINLTMCIIKVHSISVTMTASTDYILKDVAITMTCGINESIKNRTATFYRDRTFELASVTYDDGGCTSNSSYTISSICNEMEKNISIEYTPLNTPSSNQSYHCNYDDVSSDFKIIPSAVLPSVAVLSPDKTSYDIQKGQTLNTITCQASTCWPVCSFKWTGPNFSSASSALMITNIDKSSSGQYMCKATNVIGTTISDVVNVTVQYGPDSMSISPSSRVYTKTEGNKLERITCSADCRPVCSYKWIHPNGDTYNDASLTIESLQKQHHGIFTCKAQNNIGNDISSINVTVNYKPENIQLQPTPTSYVINENTTSPPITCSAQCRPECMYTWTGPHYSSSNERLQFTSISRVHQGSYTCTATNGYGDISSSAVDLIVHTTPSKVSVLTLKCTGATTAVMTWLPDLSVVPTANFTLQYKTKESGTFTNMSFLDAATQKLIYVMHVNNLNPSSEYVFAITSENYLGYKRSNEVNCITSDKAEESSLSGVVIGGIVMLTIATLLIAIVIIFVMLQKYGKMKDDTTGGRGFTNRLSALTARMTRQKSNLDEERDYVNMQRTNTTAVGTNDTATTDGSTELTRQEATLNKERNYVNMQREGTNTTAVGTNDTATTDGPADRFYDDLKRGQSQKYTYDDLQVSGTTNATPVNKSGNGNRDSGLYVNNSVIKKNKQPKPPKKPAKPKPKKASKETKDAIYMEVH